MGTVNAGIRQPGIRGSDGTCHCQTHRRTARRQDMGRKRRGRRNDVSHEFADIYQYETGVAMLHGQVLPPIKSDANIKEIPVLMLTTTDDPRAIDRCNEPGCNVSMTKSVDPSVFIAAIQRFGLLIAVVSMRTAPVKRP